jgi:hypothetical protein
MATYQRFTTMRKSFLELLLPEHPEALSLATGYVRRVTHDEIADAIG